jgi:hypothetical protein
MSNPHKAANQALRAGQLASALIKAGITPEQAQSFTHEHWCMTAQCVRDKDHPAGIKPPSEETKQLVIKLMGGKDA